MSCDPAEVDHPLFYALRYVHRVCAASDNGPGTHLTSEMLLENVGSVVIVTALIGPDLHRPWPLGQPQTRAFYKGFGIHPFLGMELQIYKTREAASDGHAAWGDSRERVAQAIHRRKALTERVIAAGGGRVAVATSFDFAGLMDCYAGSMPETELIQRIGNHFRWKLAR